VAYDVVVVAVDFAAQTPQLVQLKNIYPKLGWQPAACKTSL